MTYFLTKRRVKYSRLEFKNNLLYLIVPENFNNFENIIKKKEKWVLEKQKLIDEFLEKNKDMVNKFILFGEPIEKNSFKLRFLNGARSLEEVKSVLKQILFQKIKPIIESYSQKLGINYNKIYIRNQKTKWASCSSKRNLSFNIKMISLPEPLLNYLICHEMVHLIEKNHNKRFISLIKKEFPDYMKMEEELTKYWVVLNNNYWWRKFS